MYTVTLIVTKQNVVVSIFYWQMEKFTSLPVQYILDNDAVDF